MVLNVSNYQCSELDPERSGSNLDDLDAEERLLRISDCSKSRLFTVDLHQAFNSELFAKLRANSDVALNLIMADSFCLAFRLTGDKAD